MNYKKYKDRYDKVQIELEKAIAKHPVFPTNLFEKLAILTEEAGEVAKACNDYIELDAPIHDVKIELMQTAATCIRMYESLTE